MEVPEVKRRHHPMSSRLTGFFFARMCTTGHGRWIFLIDVLVIARRIKILTCVDDFTMECLTITAPFDISGVHVKRILISLALFRGYPAAIRTDQSPEFKCRTLGQ